MIRYKNRDTSVSNWVRARDRDICQCCGAMGGCEVHHIQPVFLEGKAEPNNLISLCPGCHKYAPNDPSKFLEYQKGGGFRWKMVFINMLCESREKNPDVTDEEVFSESVKLRLYVFAQSYECSEAPSEAIANKLCGIYPVSKNRIVRYNIIQVLRVDYQKWMTGEEILELMQPNVDFLIDKKLLTDSLYTLHYDGVLLRERASESPKSPRVYRLQCMI